jgi:hypothetical protein
LVVWCVQDDDSDDDWSMGSKKGKKGGKGSSKPAKGGKPTSSSSGSKGGGKSSSGGGADTGGSALSVSALTDMVLQLHPDMEDAGELWLDVHKRSICDLAGCAVCGTHGGGAAAAS